MQNLYVIEVHLKNGFGFETIKKERSNSISKFRRLVRCGLERLK